MSATLIDFDGDGLSDIGVYRNGVWFIRRSLDGGITAVEWGGLPQDKPVPADYDGDGKVDHAVYRDGAWFILRSSDGAQTAVGWGGASTDVPVPADYDGDGKADIAVYRNGIWFILRSSDGGQTTVGWGGVPVDVPVPEDYDGDGKTIYSGVIVHGRGSSFRSSDGEVESNRAGAACWRMCQFQQTTMETGKQISRCIEAGRGLSCVLQTEDKTTVSWGGLPQDVSVPADFDGDGKADVAVFRDGVWFIFKSSGGTQAVGWGAAGDTPLN